MKDRYEINDLDMLHSFLGLEFLQENGLFICKKNILKKYLEFLGCLSKIKLINHWLWMKIWRNKIKGSWCYKL